MIGSAAYWARNRGVATVLGGMMPVDPHWLQIMADRGVLEFIDIIGIHGFPGMWWADEPNWDWHEHWSGWNAKIDCLAGVSGGKPVWITETGLSTWLPDRQEVGLFDEQQQRLLEVMSCNAPRIYWYQMMDLDPGREAIEGFHVDENEYHLGLVDHKGRPKPALETFRRLLSPK